jgi:hypothetical protein
MVPVFDWEHFFDAWVDRAEDLRQFIRSIGKGKEEIYTADLRAAQVVARFSVLTIVPFDPVFGKV